MVKKIKKQKKLQKQESKKPDIAQPGIIRGTFIEGLGYPYPHSGAPFPYNHGYLCRH